MDEEKRELKKTSAYTLKPANIAFLIEQAVNESTPEKRMSASAILDRILDAVRQSSPSPTKIERKKYAPIESVAA